MNPSLNKSMTSLARGSRVPVEIQSFCLLASVCRRSYDQYANEPMSSLSTGLGGPVEIQSFCLLNKCRLGIAYVICKLT